MLGAARDQLGDGPESACFVLLPFSFTSASATCGAHSEAEKCLSSMVVCVG